MAGKAGIFESLMSGILGDSRRPDSDRPELGVPMLADWLPYRSFDAKTGKLGEMVDTRERLTRKQFWEAVDEDVEYSGKQLDRDIVNPSTIRSIIREVKNTLPAIFPDRISGDGSFEVPKMLVFAKTDSHAEDIIEIIREEFDESNDFCKIEQRKRTFSLDSLDQEFIQKCMD